PLDLIKVSQLDFQVVDENRFPCLALARESFRQGGTSTAILNAANEVVVESFLNHKIKFIDIPTVIEDTLQHVDAHSADSLDIILADDRRAREYSQQQLDRFNV
ncbi:MAG: 1-deoxy-D-xylulose-5-phosphate reductoisomerase, partial [Gammaproteobacteria bacterium]